MSKLYKKAGLSRDERGYFRYLGKDRQGKQVRFRLGPDENKANLVAAKLVALWERLDGEQWEDMPLAIAKAIAKGEQQAVIPPNPEMAGAESYVHWVARFQEAYGDLISVIPEQPEAFQQGQAEILAERQEAQRYLDMRFPMIPAPGEQRLHDALTDYIAHLREHEQDASGWGRVKVREAETLKDRHRDIPLSAMNLQAMENMLTLWAKRPKVKDRDRPMSKLTVRNQMKRLRDFWKWLHRSEKYAWRRPDGHDELKVRTARLPEDNAKLVKTVHIETFTLEELTTLYRHATPLVRLFILLGLNCGFSIAEIASLSLDEIRLNQPHPKLPIGSGSWVLRARHKTSVYGEWKLWPHTVQGIEWAIKRREQIKPASNLLLVSARGEAFNAKTETGNKPSRIPNLWNNLYRTAQKDKPGLRKLAFKFLRKTAGELIRQNSDGEVAGVFLTHGTPVKSDVLADVYTNRPYLKVFQALDKVSAILQPMFDAVAEPFPLRPDRRL